MFKRMPVLILLGVLLAACNLPGLARSSPSKSEVDALVTQALATLSTRAASSTPGVVSTEPSKIYFAGDTNCRSGPGIKFSLVTTIKSGQSAQLAGQPEQGEYWIVLNPNGAGPCWVVRDFATPGGDTAQVARMTAPPTYTPMPHPLAPALADWTFSCAYTKANDQSSITVTVELKWHDMSDYEFGYNIYRNGELLIGLPQNSTAYTDVTYLAAGQGISYVIEAWNYDGVARSKSANVQCK